MVLTRRNTWATTIFDRLAPPAAPPPAVDAEVDDPAGPALGDCVVAVRDSSYEVKPCCCYYLVRLKGGYRGKGGGKNGIEMDICC